MQSVMGSEIGSSWREMRVVVWFEKHGGEFKEMFNTADEYLQGAQDVMQSLLLLVLITMVILLHSILKVERLFGKSEMVKIYLL